MKRILIVYTGGTICSFSGEESRVLNVDSAKRVIVDNFMHSDSRYAGLAGELFEDSELETTTLSENMTIRKLDLIIRHILRFNLSAYAGVIILHGTDTLAYSAAILSLLFKDAPVPVMFVSANRPPDDVRTNANDNFRAAVELIEAQIAPNVYVPYRNSDGRQWLHFGSSIMQCANFTEDFYSASERKMLLIDCSGSKIEERMKELLEKCRLFYEERETGQWNLLEHFQGLENTVLCVRPYVGINYGNIELEGIKGVVHGTFHSGTICVERNIPEEPFTPDSVLHLAKRCEEKGIPIYMAPCTLDSEQYSSAYDAFCSGHILPLNMATETAYAKLLAGISCGLEGERLKEFMQAEISGEML